MKCLFSKTAGALIVPNKESNECSVVHVIDGEVHDSLEAKYAYSAVRDWREIEGDDIDSLMKNVISEYWVEQIASLLRLAIVGIEKSFELRVLEQVEESLVTDVSSEKLINQLLVAPLLKKDSCVSLTESALSKGFVSTAGILDELLDLQPLLQKLTDHWLLLGNDLFSGISEPREAIWLTLVDKCLIKKLLRVDSKRDFKKEWSNLLFYFPSPSTISGINTLGSELSNRLFIHEQIATVPAITSYKKIRPIYNDKQDYSKIGSDEALKKVKKQICEIEQAIAKGIDSKAERYLRELIEFQTSFDNGEKYLIKSLCDIAQRSADMFRMDFEAKCLNEALVLKSDDAWTLIQYGDHLKRLGKYEEALKIFNQADLYGEKIVAKSSEADIYSQQSDYEKAIEAYKNISDWINEPIVRTAIADNLRKMGNFEESKKAYKELITLAQQGEFGFDICEVRSKIGLSEIAKNQGDYSGALKIYNEVLTRKNLEQRDIIIYKLGKCNILKLMEKYDKAYAVVDEIIREFPFAMQARFLRGSILGLIGKEREGLKDLPESKGSSSWGEWLRGFYRGLLLLKLKEYGDAKDSLLEEISSAIASKEEKSIMRMAVALCYLGEGDTSGADNYLCETYDLHDCYTRYLSLVLKLHIAKQNENFETIKSLKRQIAKIPVTDMTLRKAVKEINKGNLLCAITYEADAFLKLVA